MKNSNLPAVKKPWYKRIRDWLRAEKTVKTVETEKETERVVSSEAKKVPNGKIIVDKNKVKSALSEELENSVTAEVGEGDRSGRGGTIHVMSYGKDADSMRKTGAMMRKT